MVYFLFLLQRSDSLGTLFKSSLVSASYSFSMIFASMSLAALCRSFEWRLLYWAVVSLKDEGFPYFENISTQVGQNNFISGFAQKSSSLLVLSATYHHSLGKGSVLSLLKVCSSLVVLAGICKFAYIVVVLGW